ncbi:hypothetical protein JTE90_013679 [Oedothorax gibbosus]|uniref:Uncharacterized protein n=1 Tax=Oedothorax gibbosus TaxID=931172 RepID=A0AAV6VDJ5_9ARAC|nr:hypothetical protein JTE90_013679 [Oedothorax gibbosus]
MAPKIKTFHFSCCHAGRRKRNKIVKTCHIFFLPANPSEWEGTLLAFTIHFLFSPQGPNVRSKARYLCVLGLAVYLPAFPHCSHRKPFLLAGPLESQSSDMYAEEGRGPELLLQELFYQENKNSVTMSYDILLNALSK